MFPFKFLPPISFLILQSIEKTLARSNIFDPIALLFQTSGSQLQETMPSIVVLGGNFAGVSTAHYLLRYVLPAFNTGEKAQLNVTLISPSDHTFFKVGAPRALVSNELIPLDQPFTSIPDSFGGYKPSEFTFIQGEAARIDERGKTVLVKPATEDQETTIKYDTLVIATGMKSSPLWALNGDYKVTRAAFEDLHKRIPRAETILIAGGGAVGVETAGELGHFTKGKDITILSGSTHLLSRLRNPQIGKSAEGQLESLRVNSIHKLRVVASNELPDGRTTLKLSDGSTRIVDVYIDATGGAPNSGFLPAHWLDDRKHVATDSVTLRATNAPAGVYSIGDVASYSKGSVPDATWAVPALGYSIWTDLNEMAKAKGLPPANTTLKPKEYKQMDSDTQLIPVGPKGGVGVMFGWKVPSWVVWLIKSRTFMMDKAAKVATGADVKP